MQILASCAQCEGSNRALQWACSNLWFHTAHGDIMCMLRDYSEHHGSLQLQ